MTTREEVRLAMYPPRSRHADEPQRTRAQLGLNLELAEGLRPRAAHRDPGFGSRLCLTLDAPVFGAS